MFDKILRVGDRRNAKRTTKVVDQVLALEEVMAAKSDAELAAMTDELKARRQAGATREQLRPEAFAVVREAAWRVLGQKPYPVQVFGGTVLSDGRIAEMRTGEGKTLTSTMPVYLAALDGLGVHVVTVNDYLAARDAAWMGKVHTFLGLTVDVTLPTKSTAAKKRAYAADITYGTVNEFGFDYLRDHLVASVDEQSQRGLAYALVDEIDSILIDEARTPLIISDNDETSVELHQLADQVARQLVVGEDLAATEGEGVATGDYYVDHKQRVAVITEDGIAKAEALLGVDNLYDPANTHLVGYLAAALNAHGVYRRDRDYIVVADTVQIVDEHTGRVLDGRRFSEGLHQAIEAKEQVTVQPEAKTLATVTLQNYFRSYDHLAGMTGTAMTEESEFAAIYSLEVVEVPTNRPVARIDHPDQVFATVTGKDLAIVAEVLSRHKRGQPVLIGTTSVERSEHVSTLLDEAGIPHEVLNAKQHAREAAIVAQAGRLGAVTVATNMAGRGTDILLGGNPEHLIGQLVEQATQQAFDSAQEDGREFTRADADRIRAEVESSPEAQRITADCAEERTKVLAAGGLAVIGTERHETRRIDNQLRGRSGRQGDPGETRFYLSLEDHLLQVFASDQIERLLTVAGASDDTPLTHSLVTKTIGKAQAALESVNFDLRRDLVKYDDIVNTQRVFAYEQRQRIVATEGADVLTLLDEVADEVVEDAVARVWQRDYDLAPDGFAGELPGVDVASALAGLTDPEPEQAVAALTRQLERDWQRQQDACGSVELWCDVVRSVLLVTLDRHWQQHLTDVVALRDAIGFRAMAQEIPEAAYARETAKMFSAMLADIKRETVATLVNAAIQQVDPVTREPLTDASGAPDAEVGGPDAGTDVTDGGR